MTLSVTHTLPDDVLMAYSTGQLPAVFDLVVAAHVSLSDDARARLESFDAIGGALLENVDAVPVALDSLEATLALIEQSPADAVSSPVRRDSVFPQPLLEASGGDLDAVRWSGIGMGSKQCILSDNGHASVRLLSIPPGVNLPDHGHEGMELTLVLKGAFQDGDRAFHRGDVALADEDIEHAPAVIGSETCICLAAADNRLRFQTWLPRLAQPFLRI